MLLLLQELLLLLLRELLLLHEVLLLLQLLLIEQLPLPHSLRDGREHVIPKLLEARRLELGAYRRVHIRRIGAERPTCRHAALHADLSL